MIKYIKRGAILPMSARENIVQRLHEKAKYDIETKGYTISAFGILKIGFEANIHV